MAVLALAASLLGGCSIDARDVGVDDVVDEGAVDDGTSLGSSDTDPEHAQAGARGDAGPANGGTLGNVPSKTDGKYTLTVINSSTGLTGVVDAPTTELDCGPTCSVLVDEGTRLTLRARTSNESGAFFRGWSGAGCSGASRDCELIVGGPTTVTAYFAPRLNNLIFATSALLPADLGGVRPYDRECNLIASAAGINDEAGNAYVAVMSDSALSLRTRLGASARGWVRRDGAPFADTQAALFEGAALNAVVFDENGRDIRAEPAMTGSLRDGTVSANDTCLDWTSTTGAAFGGSLSGGSSNWITGFTSPCEPRHVICMGRTRTAPLEFSEVGERTIWLSTTAYSVGAAETPDEKCQAERPPGVVNARALIATTERAASAVLDLDAVYARPDGIRVGTGDQLARRVALDSGIWQSAALVYGRRTNDIGLVFTGQAEPNSAGTAASTCSDWTDPTGTAGLVGLSWSTLSNWWAYAPFPCASMASVYCVSLP